MDDFHRQEQHYLSLLSTFPFVDRTIDRNKFSFFVISLYRVLCCSLFISLSTNRKQDVAVGILWALSYYIN